MEINKIYQGDVLTVLKTFPDESVDCIVTSPPYYGLRDYGAEGQIGLELTLGEYLDKMLAVTAELKRVLKPTGTMWWNHGDSYASLGKTGGDIDTDVGMNINRGRGRVTKGSYPEKCLLLQAHRLAIRMIDDDGDDIYELDRVFVSATITSNKTYAPQRPRTKKKILSGIREEMEIGTPRTIPQTNGGMAEEKSRESKSIQQEVLLGEQREGDIASNDRERQVSSPTQDGSPGNLWRKSSEVCLLWMPNSSFSNNRPYEQQWSTTSQGVEKIWLNLSLAQKNELSKRFSSFVYELQLGKREVRLLPPRGRQNLSLRKREIPIELLPAFKFVREERWRLRNVCIWHKPNVMPSSVRDRFTVDYEPVFFFSKSKKYFFELQYEPWGLDKRAAGLERARKYGYQGKGSYQDWYFKERQGKDWTNKKITKDNLTMGQGTRGSHAKLPLIHPLGRNKRCVWKIPTKPFAEAHFATFPPELVEIPIKAGCPQDGVVLDPFMGSGTVALVARQLGRKWVGIELSGDYIKIAERRLAQQVLF